MLNSNTARNSDRCEINSSMRFKIQNYILWRIMQSCKDDRIEKNMSRHLVRTLLRKGRASDILLAKCSSPNHKTCLYS